MNRVKSILHHLFVPKEENNFRAKALHIDFLTYYLLIALFLTFIVKSTNLTNVLGYATDITTQKLYELTNQQREQHGLADLHYNSELAVAAQKKAQDMFAKNYWAHYGPDGETPWDFILGAGYKYEYAGENLAKNFLFSQGVVDAWMNSPTHRENILRNNYTDVGFAVVNGTLNGEPTTLVVQMFGTPLPGSAVAEQITSPSAPVPASETKPIPTVAPLQPTMSPQNAIVTPSAQEPAILSKQAKASGLSLPYITLNMNIVFILFLLVALIMDFYFASRLHVFRITGKNIAHFIFIGFLGIGLILLTRGAIL